MNNNGDSLCCQENKDRQTHQKTYCGCTYSCTHINCYILHCFAWRPSDYKKTGSCYSRRCNRIVQILFGFFKIYRPISNLILKSVFFVYTLFTQWKYIFWLYCINRHCKKQYLLIFTLSKSHIFISANAWITIRKHSKQYKYWPKFQKFYSRIIFRCCVHFV